MHQYNIFRDVSLFIGALVHPVQVSQLNEPSVTKLKLMRQKQIVRAYDFM